MVNYRKKKTYTKAKAGKWSKSKTIVPAAYKSYVKRMVSKNIEHKWKSGTFQLSGNYETASNMFQFLNGVAQGTGTQNRIGARITMTELEMTLTVVPKEGVYTRVRLLAFFDKQTNGILPGNNANISSIFADTGVTGGPTTLTSPLQSNFFPSRYTLIMDRLISLDVSNNGTSAVSPERMIRIKRRLRKRVSYTGPSADIPDIVNNSLIVYAISDEKGDPPSGNAPTVIGQYKFKYVDA